MKNLITAFPLYNFLKYCNQYEGEKRILDCGAGGANPPLSLFYEFGYETYGIEVSQDQIDKAKSFCSRNNIDLNINYGDMKKIPFENEYFNFIYSYNTSVHMRKEDFLIAMSEFCRVLRPSGLCYVNFLSKECDTYGIGKELGNGEYMQVEDNEEVIFSHYNDDEIEKNFSGFEILYKEKRNISRRSGNEINTSSYYDYILQKR